VLLYNRCVSASNSDDIRGGGARRGDFSVIVRGESGKRLRYPRLNAGCKAKKGCGYKARSGKKSRRLPSA